MTTRSNGALNGGSADQYGTDEYRTRDRSATGERPEYGGSGRRDILGNGYHSGGPATTRAFETFERLTGQEPPSAPSEIPSAERGLDEPGLVPPPLRLATRFRPAVPHRPGWSAIEVPAAPTATPHPPASAGPRLRVDWPNCKAHGLCHELLPEAVRLDEWGYPVFAKQALPAHLLDEARRAVMACPTLALHLID